MQSIKSFLEMIPFGTDSRDPGRCPTCHEPRLTNPCSTCGTEFMITAKELQRLLPPNSSAPTPPPKDIKSKPIIKQLPNINKPLPPLSYKRDQRREGKIDWMTDGEHGQNPSRKKDILQSSLDAEQSAARFRDGQGAFEDAVRATMREIAPHKLSAYEAALALEKKGAKERNL